MVWRKALLIGINYEGTNNELQGCHDDVKNVREFLYSRGFTDDQMVIMLDNCDPNDNTYPTGENMLNYMRWLVEPDQQNNEPVSAFLHYSGHGSQQDSSSGDGGFEDTLCPIDYQENGMLASGVLHQTLLGPLRYGNSLHALFDCCHSGTAMELPFNYRLNEDGSVRRMNNIKQGINLAMQAAHLLSGPLSMNKLKDAAQLYAGASSFYEGLRHESENGPDGAGEAEGRYAQEAGQHRVFLFSGCRDDQTSADATISGAHVGAMSWAFLQAQERYGQSQTYVDILRNTREILAEQYDQIPQLSAGEDTDLDQPINI